MLKLVVEVDLIDRSMDEINLFVVAIGDVDLVIRSVDKVGLVLLAVDKVDLVPRSVTRLTSARHHQSNS